MGRYDCGCGNKDCKGGVFLFDKCGCTYTNGDDGIHQCSLHRNAGEVKEYASKMANLILSPAFKVFGGLAIGKTAYMEAIRLAQEYQDKRKE